MKFQYEDLFQHAPKLSNTAKNNVMSRIKNNDSRKKRHVLPIAGATIFIVASCIFLFSVLSNNKMMNEFSNGNGQPSNEGTSLIINEEQDDLTEKEAQLREQINKELRNMEDAMNERITKSMGEDEINLRAKLLKDSEIIYRALEQLDYETIATKVHPQLGVTFALYADYGYPDRYGGPYVSFSNKELLEKNNEIYQFGAHYASGEMYEMSLNEYIQNFLINHYDQKLPIREISYNEQLFSTGGIINTIHEYYPDAKYVEYFRYESDESSIDPFYAQSLRFVYQKYEGEWYLTAIVRDVYSP